MYKIDKDEVLELQNLPHPDTGAPCPTVVAWEDTVLLGYFIKENDSWFEEKYSKLFSDSSDVCLEECLAIVRFQSARCHLFGEPNGENLASHPLWKSGLKQFGTYEIGNSSWLKEIVKFDKSTHTIRDQEALAAKHYIFTFRDSTFECIAQCLSFYVRHGDILEQIQKLISELENGSPIPISMR